MGTNTAGSARENIRLSSLSIHRTVQSGETVIAVTIKETVIGVHLEETVIAFHLEETVISALLEETVIATLLEETVIAVRLKQTVNIGPSEEKAITVYSGETASIAQ